MDGTVTACAGEWGDLPAFDKSDVEEFEFGSDLSQVFEVILALWVFGGVHTFEEFVDVPVAFEFFETGLNVGSFYLAIWRKMSLKTFVTIGFVVWGYYSLLRF